jgi:2',3'-cyclic-nucleotide 2'-phosphodiesterase (5'-nucleotidase family)
VKRFLFLLGFPVFFTIVTLPAYAEQFTIVYTANTSGKLTECGCPSDPYGGLAERATLIKKLRSKEKSFLLLDAGNMVSLFGDFEERAACVARLMNLMGYDASCAGKQEMFNGSKIALNMTHTAKFPIISTTIAWKIDSKPVFRQYCILKAGKSLVGIIAVCDSSCYITDGSRTFDYISLPLEATVKPLLEEIAPKVDFIIALSQMNTGANEKLLKSFPQIDLVIEGYGNNRLERPLPSSQGFVVAPGDRGQFVGLATFEKQKNSRAVLKRTEMLPVLEIEADEMAMDIVKSYYRNRK